MEKLGILSSHQYSEILPVIDQFDFQFQDMSPWRTYRMACDEVEMEWIEVEGKHAIFQFLTRLFFYTVDF